MNSGPSEHMSDPVSTIRNLGPSSEAAFMRAGITSAQELHALGADDAYRRLIESGAKPHFIGYLALVMGLQGRPWNDCKGRERIQLRFRFDTLKSATAANSDSRIEASLNEIGVVPRRI